MLSFIVVLKSGRRYTVRAEEMRFGCDGCVELWATPAPTDTEPQPEQRIVAVFHHHETETVVAREFLVSEEKCDPTPHVVRRDDAIPF